LGLFEVRKWTGAEWELVSAINGEGCNTEDTACAFNNGGSIANGGWDSFTRQGNPTTTLDRNAFTEMGVNLSQVLGDAFSPSCQVSFVAKSRSSSSLDSELKDFEIGELTFCDARVQVFADSALTDTSAAARAGDSHEFTVLVEQIGPSTGFSWEPAEGAIVQGLVVPSLGSDAVLDPSSTCVTSATLADGTCTLLVSSTSTGQATISASATVDLNGSAVTVNSNEATMTWVDADVTLTMASVGQVDHVVVASATVLIDTGDGSGPSDGAGETISFSDHESNDPCSLTCGSARLGLLR
jgi:hypothetical protein